MAEEFVGKVIDCSEELVTVFSVTDLGPEGFALRLSFHPDGTLGHAYKSAAQIIPLEALDQESILTLQKFEEDSKFFVYKSRKDGGNVYALRLTQGFIRFDETVERTNPMTGSPVIGFGSFSHSHLKVRKMASNFGGPKFDPSLGKLPAKATPVPAPAKSAAKRR